MQTIILVIHVLLALALIGVVLMQRSEAGLGSLGGGASGGLSLMSGRTTANLLTRSTAILAGAFMFTSILLAILAGSENRGSVLDRAPELQPLTIPAPQAPAQAAPAPAVPAPANIPGATPTVPAQIPTQQFPGAAAPPPQAPVLQLPGAAPAPVVPAPTPAPAP